MLPRRCWRMATAGGGTCSHDRRFKFLHQMITKRMSSYLSMHRKRFYREANALPHHEGYYYIQLDGKTIKTPLLNKLYAPTLPLALGICNEWNMQVKSIDTHSMPLTSICNTAIDNPTKISKTDLVSALTAFLHTDTICCTAEEPDALIQRQNEKWTPVRNWFAERYNVSLRASSDLFTLEQDDATITALNDELLKLNAWQLSGLQTAVDGIKSLVLPLAVVGDEITVEDAVYLSRLETEFQMEKWGRFDAVHDVDQFNQETALAAGVLFYQLASAGPTPETGWNL